jgi:hypothetical protein
MSREKLMWRTVFTFTSNTSGMCVSMGANQPWPVQQLRSWI